MLKYLVFFVVFATSHVALTHNVPEECRHKLKKEVMECCDIPKMFAQEEWTACGFSMDDPPMHEKPPHGPSCDKTICLMKKFDLISGEDKVNKEAMKALVDKMTSDDPDFASLGEIVKSNCIDKDLSTTGPPDMCEPMKIHHCIQKSTMAECPKWKETPECALAQQHVEDCKPYLKKHD